jgi:hypothetical protein
MMTVIETADARTAMAPPLLNDHAPDFVTRTFGIRIKEPFRELRSQGFGRMIDLRPRRGSTICRCRLRARRTSRCPRPNAQRLAGRSRAAAALEIERAGVLRNWSPQFALRSLDSLRDQERPILMLPAHRPVTSGVKRCP